MFDARGSLALLLPWLLCLGACSQIGPSTIDTARFDYNEAIARSFDRQMLLNLVRLRYQDSILFLDLTSVVASYARELRLGSAPNTQLPDPSLTIGVNAGATWSETPTVTYAPLQGEEFAKRLLAPIQPSSILLLSRSGWGLERLLLCAVQQLNDLPNGTAVGGVAPLRVHHFTNFRRVARLLKDLQENGYIELTTLTGQNETIVLSTGPIPMDAVARREGDEVLRLLDIRGHEGFGSVPRESSAPASKSQRDQWPGSEAPKHESLPHDSPPRDSAPPLAPEASARGASVPITPPITVDTPSFPRSAAHLVVSGRSILGVLTFLAQHVDVPDEHVRRGLVRVTLGPDGRRFDWHELSGGLFHIRNSPHEPTDAFLRVHYRGHWFYIDDTDIESKSTYTLLAELFSLQAANGNVQAPVLTLPAR